MDTGFDFWKFVFSTETWTGIFTIGAAIWGGWKAHKAREAEKGTKSKTSEIDTLKKIIDELQQERDNDKDVIADLRQRLEYAENHNPDYISDRPTIRRQAKSLRPKQSKRLKEPESEGNSDI